METPELTRLERSFVATSDFSRLLAELTERERHLDAWTSSCKPEPVVTIIRRTSRGRQVAFRYLDNGERRPAWLEPVLQGFANLVTLNDNWDGEGARRIDPATINRALAAMEEVLPRDASAPSIVPLQNSGLQVEWHSNGKDLEIEFNPTGSVTFYYFDGPKEDALKGYPNSSLCSVTAGLARQLE